MNRLPLVNLNVIGTRPEPVVPDGVWIEVQPHVETNEASHNAELEEQRINAANRDKTERLRKFQKDVKRRVTRAAYLQRSNVANMETKQMEHEIDMLYRSASAAEKATPKKNRCSYNVNPITIDCSGKISAVELPYSDIPEKVQPIAKLDERSQEHEGLVKEARKRLVQNLIAPLSKPTPSSNEDSTKLLLPGGVWGTSSTRDKSAVRTQADDFSEDQAPEIPNEQDHEVQTVPAVSAPDDVALKSVQESIIQNLSSKIDDSERLTDISTAPNMNDGAGDSLHLPPCHVSSKIPSVVHFNVDSHHWKSEVVQCDDMPVQSHHVSKSAEAGDMPLRISENIVPRRNGGRKIQLGVECFKPPVLHPGAVALDERKANQRARWLSRRVFADAERERTREQARMRDHQQRVERLREAKERERAEIEQKSRDQVDAIRIADEQLRQQVKKEERQRARAKQTKVRKEKQDLRFVRAMKSQLRERVEQNKMELPPLCMCASTFWQTDPGTCANNCLFYKNHEAYAKALEAVLQAVERNMGPFHKDALQRSAISLPLDSDTGPTPFSARRSTSARSQSSSLSVGKL
uniref:Chromatin assembly factor 1 subunit A-A n=1 Tax=Phallusia mammillata TaxID=59560 RepID=A0A6F9D920_9ASCI|nr:chromatin assembly factor 1 subunit A-A [Phallusia mammillata]